MFELRYISVNVNICFAIDAVVNFDVNASIVMLHVNDPKNVDVGDKTELTWGCSD